MNFVKIFIITIVLMLLGSCKRTCQDERADNYNEGHRKENCDFSHADNWDKDIIVDSILINGTKIDLYDELWGYYTNPAYDSQTEKDWEYMKPTSARNDYSGYLDEGKDFPDTLKSISYFIGIPVASNYSVNVGRQNFSMIYIDTLQNTLEHYNKNEEVFNFIETKEVDGIVYYFYHVEVENIENQVIVNQNFDSAVISINVSFQEYFLSYEVGVFGK